MTETTITPERVDAVFQTIPPDANGVGFRVGEVFFVFDRLSSGIYRGEPYTKPAHIQIKTSVTRFWINRIDSGIELLYDPSGKMSLIALDDIGSIRELDRLFNELEKKLDLQRKARQKEDNKSRINVNDGKTFIDSLLSWCNKDRLEKIQRAVENAILNPEGYLQKNRTSLAGRGIYTCIPGLHIIALVDALLTEGLSVEIDWNEESGIILNSVSHLAENFNREIGLMDSFSQISLEEYLKHLGKQLSAFDLKLVSIDIESDSYVLCLIPKDAFHRALPLTKSTGIKLSAW